MWDIVFDGFRFGEKPRADGVLHHIDLDEVFKQFMSHMSDEGSKMKQKDNTLIFIDEIQAYPHLLTLLKFLSQDDHFTYFRFGEKPRADGVLHHIDLDEVFKQFMSHMSDDIYPKMITSPISPADPCWE